MARVLRQQIEYVLLIALSLFPSMWFDVPDMNKTLQIADMQKALRFHAARNMLTPGGEHICQHIVLQTHSHL